MITVTYAIVLPLGASCNIFFALPNGDEGWCSLPGGWIEMANGRNLSRRGLDRIERALYEAMRAQTIQFVRVVDEGLQPVPERDIRWFIGHWQAALSALCTMQNC